MTPGTSAGSVASGQKGSVGESSCVAGASAGAGVSTGEVGSTGAAGRSEVAQGCGGVAGGVMAGEFTGSCACFVVVAPDSCVDCQQITLSGDLASMVISVCHRRS